MIQKLKTYWRELLIVLLLVAVVILAINPKYISTNTNVKVNTRDSIIKIPAISGEFNKPDNVNEIPSKTKDSIIYKEIKVYVESKINKDVIKRYIDAEDKLKEFTNAIRQRDYTTDFSDENLELTIITSVEGKLISEVPKYKIKEKEAKVQIKEVFTTITNTIEKKDKFGVLIGGGYNHSLDLLKPSNFEVNAGIRLGKVNIIGSANTAKQVGGKILIEL